MLSCGVRVSVTFVDSVKMNKYVYKFVHHGVATSF